MLNTPIDVILQPFSPITPSQAGVQTVSAEFPCRYDYRDIELDLGSGGAAITPAMIQEVRLKANGQVILRSGGTVLDAINQYYKAPAAAQVLSLMARRLGIRGGAQAIKGGTLISGSAKDLSLETNLNTGSFNKAGQGISSLICEIDIINSPAGAPRILPFAQVTDPYPGGAGIVRLLDKTSFVAVSGSNTASKSNALLYGDPNHAMLNALYIVAPTSVLSNYQFFFNNNLILQRTQAQNAYLQQVDALRDPLTFFNTYNGVVLEWSPTGFGDEVLNIQDPSTDMRLIFNSTVAEALAFYQDSFGYPFGRPDQG